VYSFTTPIGVVKLYKVSIVQAKMGKGREEGERRGKGKGMAGKRAEEGERGGKGKAFSHLFC